MTNPLLDRPLTLAQAAKMLPRQANGKKVCTAFGFAFAQLPAGSYGIAVVASGRAPSAIRMGIDVPAGGDIPDTKMNEKFKHKLDLIDELAAWFPKTHKKSDAVIAVGDFNIAPLEHDSFDSIRIDADGASDQLLAVGEARLEAVGLLAVDADDRHCLVETEIGLDPRPHRLERVAVLRAPERAVGVLPGARADVVAAPTRPVKARKELPAAEPAPVAVEPAAQAAAETV